MLKVCIVDDHPIVRQGLRQILAEAQDMTIVSELATGLEVLESIKKDPCDIVVMDITLPGMNGIDVLKQIKREKPGIPVLMLSIHPEDEYAVRALKAGAAGYLTKGSAPNELLNAIRTVSTGSKYITSALAEELISDIQGGGKQPHEQLSNREYEIMCMIASGKRIKEIASELMISTKTVSTYRTRILEKMKMVSNAEITRYVLENHIT
jgi:two-component system, NarL family, invasion response regulator UvrY